MILTTVSLINVFMISRCKELETELERSRKETAVLNLKLCEARQQTPSYPTIRPNVPGEFSIFFSPLTL